MLLLPLSSKASLCPTTLFRPITIGSGPLNALTQAIERPIIRSKLPAVTCWLRDYTPQKNEDKYVWDFDVSSYNKDEIMKNALAHRPLDPYYHRNFARSMKIMEILDDMPLYKNVRSIEFRDRNVRIMRIKLTDSEKFKEGLSIDNFELEKQVRTYKQDVIQLGCELLILGAIIFVGYSINRTLSDVHALLEEIRSSKKK